MGDIIKKIIEISGDASGFQAALDEAENQARTAAARLEQIDKALDDRRRQREEAEAQRSTLRNDAVVRRGLDVRIAGLEKEEDALRRSLDRQQTALEKAEQRVNVVRTTAAKQRVTIAQQELQQRAQLEQTFAGRFAQGAARGIGPVPGFPVPFLGGGIAGIGGALAGAAVGFAIKKAVTDTLDWTTAIRELMLITREGAQETSTFAIVAERFGIDAGKLGDALRNLASAAAQNSEQFKAMGIELNNLDGSAKSPLQLFMEFRQVFQGATKDTHTLRAAQEILGRSYTDLLPLLNASDDEMKAWTASAAKSAKVLTTEGLDANVRYQQSLAELNDGFQSLVVRVGGFVIPILAQVAEAAMHAADIIGLAAQRMGGFSWTDVLPGNLPGKIMGGLIKGGPDILAEADRLAAERASRARAAAEAITKAGGGTGPSIATKSDLADAQRAFTLAAQERITAIREESTARVEAMQDTLKAFERERDVALRTIQDESKARENQHRAELGAIESETRARDDAYRARERQRDDAITGLREELRALDAVTNSEKARADLADAEANLASERNVEVFRSASQTEEQYRSATDQQRRRVVDAEKKVADQKKALTQDTARSEIEVRIRAIEKERELDRRALEDYKQGADDRVRTIRSEMQLEKDAADTRIQQIRDEMDAERIRIADLITEEQRATREIIAELQKRQAAAAGSGGGGGGALAKLGPGNTTVGPGSDEPIGGGPATEFATAADAQRWFQQYLGRAAGPEEIAGRLGTPRSMVERDIRDSLEARIRAADMWNYGGKHDYPHSMTLTEPTLMVGMRSGRSYGVAAARGDEDVTFGGVGDDRGGDSMTVVIPLHINGREIGRAVGEIKARRAGHGYGRRR